MKQSCAFLAHLYISCLVRQGNIKEFFSYENQSYPPSLSQDGMSRTGSKSDLVPILERFGDGNSSKPDVDVLMLDGAAIEHMSHIVLR